MLEEVDTQIAELAASLSRGSIVAAAGCGKTEQIALAAKIAEGRRLILTHTHAGVDALRSRLKKHKVPSDKYHVDTIAGWCLWYVTSFPQRSGYLSNNTTLDVDWNVVYQAAARLIESGTVKTVLAASYSGVFVDEYQDCTDLQHQVIKAIADYLSVCVFGDRLQAIFDFKGQKPVDWDSDVFPVFGKAKEMTRPWRWMKAGNDDLAKWLVSVRDSIEKKGVVDLRNRPRRCVSWEELPLGDPQSQQQKIIGVCKSRLGKVGDGSMVLIGDPAKISSRADLAQKLASSGFSNIEPISCERLYEFTKKIEAATGFMRLEQALDFIGDCMTQSEKSEYLKAVKSHQSGRKAGASKFGSLIAKGIAVAECVTDEALIELMEGFRNRENTRLFRREMFYAMLSALRSKSTGQHNNLTDAIWQAQNRTRHIGRTISKRSIGSTLLVKGLEFDHAVIVHTENMSRKDWYVALTRATTSLTILSPSECFSPKEKDSQSSQIPLFG